MYIPENFQWSDINAMCAMIHRYPLAQLIANCSNGLVANPLPLILKGEAKLIGHLAKNNQFHEIIDNRQDVLAIFQGAENYISPNWYPSKAEHHKQVPTWNYQIVQVHGKITFFHDEKAKRAAVGLLTKKMESEVNGEAAWKMADAPTDYMQTMLENIVAFEIDITCMLGKTKLSQNKEMRDRENVAKLLLEGKSTALGQLMKDEM